MNPGYCDVDNTFDGSKAKTEPAKVDSIAGKRDVSFDNLVCDINDDDDETVDASWLRAIKITISMRRRKEQHDQSDTACVSLIMNEAQYGSDVAISLSRLLVVAALVIFLLQLIIRPTPLPAGDVDVDFNCGDDDFDVDRLFFLMF